MCVLTSSGTVIGRDPFFPGGSSQKLIWIPSHPVFWEGSVNSPVLPSLSLFLYNHLNSVQPLPSLFLPFPLGQAPCKTPRQLLLVSWMFVGFLHSIQFQFCCFLSTELSPLSLIYAFLFEDLTTPQDLVVVLDFSPSKNWLVRKGDAWLHTDQWRKDVYQNLNRFQEGIQLLSPIVVLNPDSRINVLLPVRCVLESCHVTATWLHSPCNPKLHPCSDCPCHLKSF